MYRTGIGHIKEVREGVRKETMRKWQKRCEEEKEKPQWNKRLIPDVVTWTECGHIRTTSVPVFHRARVFQGFAHEDRLGNSYA